jgi:hypothetical protein
LARAKAGPVRNWLDDLHWCGNWLWSHLRLGRRDWTLHDRFLTSRGLWHDSRLGWGFWSLYLWRFDFHFGQLALRRLRNLGAARGPLLGAGHARQHPERNRCQQGGTRPPATTRHS